MGEDCSVPAVAIPFSLVSALGLMREEGGRERKRGVYKHISGTGRNLLPIQISYVCNTTCSSHFDVTTYIPKTISML